MTYANVAASVALFLTLTGGIAWALEANSVKSRHIVNDQVKSADVRDDSLKGGGLTGRDIREDTLDTVPSASDADTLDGFDSSDFQDAGVTHNSGLKSVEVPDTGTPATTDVLTAGPFTFQGTCQFAGQEAYANIRVFADDDAYLATEVDGGQPVASTTLDVATIPIGGGTAEAGKTRSLTAIELSGGDAVFQGEAFYAILEEYDRCFFVVSGILG